MTSRKQSNFRGNPEGGFSLLEMLVVAAILSIVFAVIIDAMSMFQQRGGAEAQKVDSVQMARDFLDQVNRDLHDVGYPPPAVISGSGTCVGNVALACGIVYYSPLKVQYEGDLDGTGTVYQVTLQVVPNAAGSCPCVLQRGVVTKTAALAGTVPTYYTEVNGLLNTGNWAGVASYSVALGSGGAYNSYSTTDVFDGYYNDATQVTTSCTSAAACVGSATPIRELQITANVAPTYSDPTTKLYPVFSLTSKARISNVAR
jgi:prepilin-type N-terminal cleavage/methylation domain-containing protein